MTRTFMFAMVSLLLASCGPKNSSPTPSFVVCDQFSFEVSNRTQVDQARRDFYEAAILFGRHFSDSSRVTPGIETSNFTYTQALFYADGGTISLTGSQVAKKDKTPIIQMKVQWFDTAKKSNPNAITTPCTFPNGRERFAQIRRFLSNKWQLEQQ